MSDRIPFYVPAVGAEEAAAVAEILESGWLTSGDRASAFQEAFRSFVDAPAALAVGSCTAALHLSLLALGVGPGSRVVTTPMTFVSTIHVIEQTGAVPVLVDIEPGTLNIDPAGVARAAADGRVDVVLPVHLYGHPCDMTALDGIAAELGAAVVEDAAHAFAARWDGKPIGSERGPSGLRRLTCFSFYATKNLTSAEGGMVTGPVSLVEEASRWALHGMDHDAWRRYGESGTWRYDVDRAGFKYNLSDVHAAIGLVQLRRAGALQARRTELAARYTAGLAGHPAFVLPQAAPGAEHAWHLYVVRVTDGSAVTRDALIEELRARGIGTSVHFIPVHRFSYHRQRYGWNDAQLPVASDAGDRVVSLPFFPTMTDAQVDRVVEELIDIAGRP